MGSERFEYESEPFAIAAGRGVGEGERGPHGVIQFAAFAAKLCLQQVDRLGHLAEFAQRQRELDDRAASARALEPGREGDAIEGHGRIGWPVQSCAAASSKLLIA